MLRLSLLLFFFFSHLYACQGAYESCKLKIRDSHSIQNNQLNLLVSKHTRVIYSTKKPSATILKYDPYLSLYLIQDRKGFAHPFRINNKLTSGVAALTGKNIIKGRILQHQRGLNHLATFSKALVVPSILLSRCCSLEGVVTPRGIIEKEYIDRFLKIKKVSYSDIGIRVEDAQGDVIVNAANPFMLHNPFEVGDVILSYDKKKVHNSADLMRWILFSELGSTHTLKVKHHGTIKRYRVVSHKRYGGGALSDTFLEILGISFDKNLYIVKIAQKAKKYQLKIGDKLIQINHKNIKNEQQISKIISQKKDGAYLLFERYDFQFFVKVN